MRKERSEDREINSSAHEKKSVITESRIDDDISVATGISPEMISDDLIDISNVETMMKKDDVSLKRGKDDSRHVIVIIPCFNEGFSIGSVIVKARRYADDIVVVDDGSSDDTAKIASALGVHVISHHMNLGKSAAIKTGFKYSLGNGFDYIVTLDGDGQHDPNEIPKMINNLRKMKSDILIGTRSGERTEMPFYRRIGKRVLDYATSLGNGGMVTDSQSGFRVYTKKALTCITPKLRGSAFSTESEQLLIASDMGFHVDTYPITCKYQSVGDSSMTSTKSPTSHGFGVLGYVLWIIAEKRPLLFIGVPGFFLVMAGLLSGIRTFQLYNQSGVFPISYAVITSILMMLGALGLFMGLLLNTLPHIVRKTLDEKEMEEFGRNQHKRKK